MVLAVPLVLLVQYLLVDLVPLKLPVDRQIPLLRVLLVHQGNLYLPQVLGILMVPEDQLFLGFPLVLSHLYHPLFQLSLWVPLDPGVPGDHFDH